MRRTKRRFAVGLPSLLLKRREKSRRKETDRSKIEISLPCTIAVWDLGQCPRAVAVAGREAAQRGAGDADSGCGGRRGAGPQVCCSLNILLEAESNLVCVAAY